MKCPRCRHENRTGAKYCEECGTPFTDPSERGLQAGSYADLQNALSEALEQQTATSEILKVISRSMDLQPVFDAIAASALRLCNGLFSIVVRYDGETIHLVALANVDQEAGEAIRRQFPYRPSRASAGGRAILDARVVYGPDIRKDPEYRRRNVAGRPRTAIRKSNALCLTIPSILRPLQ